MPHNTPSLPSLDALYADMGGVREIFSPKASDYAAARPGYPDALFDTLQEEGLLMPETRVADLGAGTGLLTRGFLARGYAVVAVEPNAAMRAAADRILGEDPNYRSVPGSAEATTLADASVDLVAAAQAFHWFDPVATRRECLRILRPLGMGALIWNNPAQKNPFQEALEELLARMGGPRRTALLAQGEHAAEILALFFGGEPIRTRFFRHEHALDRPGLLSLVFSHSYAPARESAAGKRVQEWSETLFDRFAISGAVVSELRTELIWGPLQP